MYLKDKLSSSQKIVLSFCGLFFCLVLALLIKINANADGDVAIADANLYDCIYDEYSTISSEWNQASKLIPADDLAEIKDVTCDATNMGARIDSASGLEKLPALKTLTLIHGDANAGWTFPNFPNLESLTLKDFMLEGQDEFVTNYTQVDMIFNDRDHTFASLKTFDFSDNSITQFGYIPLNVTSFTLLNQTIDEGDIATNKYSISGYFPGMCMHKTLEIKYAGIDFSEYDDDDDTAVAVPHLVRSDLQNLTECTKDVDGQVTKDESISAKTGPGTLSYNFSSNGPITTSFDSQYGNFDALTMNISGSYSANVVNPNVPITRAPTLEPMSNSGLFETPFTIDGDAINLQSIDEGAEVYIMDSVDPSTANKQNITSSCTPWVSNFGQIDSGGGTGSMVDLNCKIPKLSDLAITPQNNQVWVDFSNNVGGVEYFAVGTGCPSQFNFTYVPDDLPYLVSPTTDFIKYLSLDGSAPLANTVNTWDVTGVNLDKVAEMAIGTYSPSDGYLNLNCSQTAYDLESEIETYSCTFDPEKFASIFSSSIFNSTNQQNKNLYFYLCQNSDCSSLYKTGAASESTGYWYEIENGVVPNLDSETFSDQDQQINSQLTFLELDGDSENGNISDSYNSWFQADTKFYMKTNNGDWGEISGCDGANASYGRVDCDGNYFANNQPGDKVYIKVVSDFGTYTGTDGNGGYWEILTPPFIGLKPNSSSITDGEGASGTVDENTGDLTLNSGFAFYFSQSQLISAIEDYNWDSDGMGLSVKFGATSAKILETNGDKGALEGGDFSFSDGCAMWESGNGSFALVCALPGEAAAIGRTRSVGVQTSLDFDNSGTVVYSIDGGIFTFTKDLPDSDPELCDGTLIYGIDGVAECDIEINYTINQQITLQVNKGVTTITPPADGGAAIDDGDLWAEVKTNADKGYLLSIEGERDTGAGCATDNLLCTGTATGAETISTLGTAGTLQDNTWGYSALRADSQTKPDADSATFQPIPTTETTMVTSNSVAFSNQPTAGERTWLFFGAKDNGATPAGDYSGKVRVIATAQI
ncbi:MAG: hypothetical protein LBM13_03410 [Candidatus Ancillula sp.]|jgi:hypothetical protein|nr:hypothetical protein [Candidatus Ancillula sp.]